MDLRGQKEKESSCGWTRAETSKGRTQGNLQKKRRGGSRLQVMDWSTMTRSEAADEAGKEKTTEAAGIGVTADA